MINFQSKMRGAALLVMVAGTVTGAQAALTIGSLSQGDEWVPVLYADPNPEIALDQQTGQAEGDLVGSASDPFFLSQFEDKGADSKTDGTLAFRARLGNDKNPSGYANTLYVGIDANRDNILDVYVGVNNSGSSDEIGIWRADNSDPNANQSIGTVTFGTQYKSYAEADANYNWRAVGAGDIPVGSSTDLDGSGAAKDIDHYLSFAIDFADLVAALGEAAIDIDEDTGLRYVVGTSTQPNKFNQDVGGLKGKIKDGSNETLPWSDIGAVTEVITATGSAVPEPSSALLSVFGGVLLLMRRRR